MALTGGRSEEVTVEIGGDSTGLQNAIGGALSSLSEFRTQIGLASTAVAGLGTALLTDAVGAAGDFDQAMTESLAIMDDVSETMEEDMAGAAREVAKETTFSAEQAAESYFFLASAGMEAEEAIDALPEVAEFAQAGMFDMAEATDILTDAQSALGEENVELVELSDMLVAANQEANASVEEFGTALTNKAAPAMDRLGVETEQGVAALAAFADQGLKGNQAGTILARTLEGLDQQARNNAEEFEELGVQVFDADGEMRDLTDIVGDLEHGLDGMSTKQRAAALEQLGFNERAQQGLDLLIGNTDQLAEYEQSLADSGGAAGDVADNQLESFNARVELLRSELADIRLEIGQQLLPVIEDFVDWLSVGVQRFGQVNDATDGTLGRMTALGTVAGTVVAALGAVVAFIGAKFIVAILAIGAVVAAVATAWSENWLGIQDITMKVVDFVVDAVQWWLETVLEFWDEHGDEIIETATTTFEIISSTIETVLNFIWNEVIQPILGRIEEFWDEHGDEIIETVTWMFETLESIISTTLDLLVNDLILPVLDVLQEAWDEHGEDLVENIQWAFGRLVDIIEWALTTVHEDVIEPIIEVIDALWDEFGEDIIEMTEIAFEFIVDVIEETLDIILEAIDLFFNILQGDWEEAWENIEGITDSMLSIIETTIESSVEMLKVAVQAIADAIIGVFEWMAEQIVGNSIIPDLLDDIVQVFENAVEMVENAVEMVTDAIMAPFEKLDGLVDDALDTAMDAGQNAISASVGGFRSAASSVASAVSDALPSASDIRSQVSSAMDGASDALESAQGRVSDAAETGARAVRNVWPSSDAEEGPLSNWTDDVEKPGEMMADGMESSIPDIHKAARKASEALSIASQIDVSGSAVSVDRQTDISVKDDVTGALRAVGLHETSTLIEMQTETLSGLLEDLISAVEDVEDSIDSGTTLPQ